METNLEKYGDKLRELAKLGGIGVYNQEPRWCDDIDCGKCALKNCVTCYAGFIQWALKPAYPTLTHFEKELLLRFYDAGYYWIAYDEIKNCIFVCVDEPMYETVTGKWFDCTEFFDFFLTKDFAFIKEERGTKFAIRDLLDNCLVDKSQREKLNK